MKSYTVIEVQEMESEYYLDRVIYASFDSDNNFMDQLAMDMCENWGEAVEVGMMYATETDGATSFTLSMGYGDHPYWEEFEKDGDCWKSVGSKNLDELEPLGLL